MLKLKKQVKNNTPAKHPQRPKCCRKEVFRLKFTKGFPTFLAIGLCLNPVMPLTSIEKVQAVESTRSGPQALGIEGTADGQIKITWNAVEI